MAKSKLIASVLLSVFLLATPIGIVYAEETGGYGAESAPAAGGYGAESTPAAPAAGGYGAESTPAAGGYGAESTPAAGGYGAESTPAAPAAQKPSNTITLGFVLSALLVGIMLGWVLQRGRFCMNSAFRDTIFLKDMTFMRAYVLALLVSILGTHILNDLGMIKLSRQLFQPIAQIGGGFVFGLGIVLAGGCGSGIWYRSGEGLLAAWVAIFGFFVGIAATVDGVLNPLYKWMKSYTLPIAGHKDAGLWQIVGEGNTVKWIVIAVLLVAGILFVNKGQPFKRGKQKGYYWSLTGLLIGLISVLAFWTSDYFGGFTRGLSFTTPTRELFLTIITGNAKAPVYFPMRELLTIKTTWGVFFIIGVPLGAYLSARGLNEFLWKVPPAKELLTVFGGSLMMGFGAATAGGCNMGQGITGFTTLSIGSIAATIAIILGNWTMVYFKFIKPMNDLDI